MAQDDKKGPVKPPIIDAKPTSTSNAERPSSSASTNRPTGASPSNATSTPSAASKSDTSHKSRPGTSQSPRSQNAKNAAPTSSNQAFGSTILAALLGGAIGVGGTSLMALNNIPPFEQATPKQEFSSTIEQVQKRIFDLENAPKTDLSNFAQKQDLDDVPKIAALNTLSDAQAELVAQVETLQTQIDQMASRPTTPQATTSTAELDEVRQAITTTQTELAALKTSIIELSPDKSAATEQQLAQNEKVEQAIAQLAALKQKQQENDKVIEALQTDLTATQTALDDLTTDVTSAATTNAQALANLPLILNAWEEAIKSGAPFGTYLQKTTNLLPQISASNELMDIAPVGVRTVAELQADWASLIEQFVQQSSQLPQNASWTDKLAAQAKSAIGLRPLDQSGGDPLAIVSQVETALANGDLQRAYAAFVQLPSEYVARSGPFAVQLKTAHDVRQFITEARQTALDLITSSEEPNS